MKFFTILEYLRNHPRHVVVAVLILLILAVKFVPALNPDPRRGELERPRISEFFGYEFGSSFQDVRKEPPVSALSQTDTESIVLFNEYVGTRMIMRDRSILGTSVDVSLVFGPNDRLIKGIFEVHLPLDRSCKVPYVTFRNAIERRYRLEPEIHRRRAPPSRPFCELVRTGEAQIVTGWVDPNSEARITMSLGLKSTDVLTILFESDQYYQLKPYDLWPDFLGGVL